MIMFDDICLGSTGPQLGSIGPQDILIFPGQNNHIWYLEFFGDLKRIYPEEYQKFQNDYFRNMFLAAILECLFFSPHQYANFGVSHMYVGESWPDFI